MKPVSLRELAQHLGAKLVGDGELMIQSVSTLSRAGKGQISFLSNSKYRSQLADTSASAVILGEDDLPHCPCAALVLDNPYVGFALVAQLMDTTPAAADSISPNAVIADDAVLGEGVVIGANAVIEAGVVLGDKVQIGAGCVIGRNSRIGARTKLWANVTLYHDVEIGEDCLLQSGAVIGADGFGYANDRGRWIKIPQLGRVILGNRVEIGASTTVDRGALEDTILHDGVIIDNQCQIAHNVVIGENTAMAGCSVIGGSTRIGRNCTIGGLSAITGHVEIADNVHFTGMSMVTKGVTEPGLYSSGLPSQSSKEWRKAVANVRNLDKLGQRVKVLEKKCAERD
ncbi:UDP-3-O-(3-hydroxymyristoyl)glucosamine N-acyltransferase [Bowmanella sp. Y26]|uniref:UDP-3-O-(3-hydroxymyristoyl)glucosamine N-acyltransferase n=1 Tax=Bowmanella yangjiangensis TaxID=2811230 RepID=UPI001BDD3DDC|nr:UDP-3-O-(3-hydroxymyristoyl)glucosamine N-acyltransferase [Bowmanella yangjiangensis]MBT1065704.1 UDP-3-O-(3-hydroxymyristoyl)glucosamine N-acyltransferase [Bowmanella yangjiangensis]